MSSRMFCHRPSTTLVGFTALAFALALVWAIPAAADDVGGASDVDVPAPAPAPAPDAAPCDGPSQVSFEDLDKLLAEIRAIENALRALRP